MIDVAIVGAGPAGCAAASVLAKRGYNVTIFEKEHLPRYKSCGGGVAIRCLKSLYQLGVNVENVALQDYKGFIISYDEIKAKSDLGRTIGWGVYRKDFDFLLTQNAINNGAKLENFEITGIQDDSDKVRILMSNGEYKEAMIVLAADGIRSKVRKSIGVAYDLKKLGFCLESDVKSSTETIDSFGDLVHLDFTHLNKGFLWAFPKKCGSTINFGAGGYLDFIQNSKFSLKDILVQFVKSFNLSINNDEIKGALLPFGGTTESFGKNNCLLLGDAAGLCSPLDGEGIPYALESGIVAADCVNDYFENQTPLLKSYSDMIEPLANEINIHALTLQHKLFGSNHHRKRIVETCANNDYLIDTITKIFMHIIPYDEGVKKLSYLKVLASSLHH